MVTIPNADDDHVYDEELVTVTLDTWYDSGEDGYPEQGWYFNLGVDDPPYGGAGEWWEPEGPFETHEEAIREGKIALPTFLAILAEGSKEVQVK